MNVFYVLKEVIVQEIYVNTCTNFFVAKDKHNLSEDELSWRTE